MSIDLSRTYMEWAAHNLAANGIEGVALERWPPVAAADLSDTRDSGAGAPQRRRPARSPRRGHTATIARHRLVQADCLRWIAEADGTFDLIWLDPPTFSNSARMGGATFDVQRDHADLMRMVARRFLTPDGILLFSSNRRDFVLDGDALSGAGLRVGDLSRSTLPPDFARGARSHHVFRVSRERERTERDGGGREGMHGKGLGAPK